MASFRFPVVDLMRIHENACMRAQCIVGFPGSIIFPSLLSLSSSRSVFLFLPSSLPPSRTLVPPLPFPTSDECLIDQSSPASWLCQTGKVGDVQRRRAHGVLRRLVQPQVRRRVCAGE